MIRIEVRAKPAAPGRPEAPGGYITIDNDGRELSIVIESYVGDAGKGALMLDGNEAQVLATALICEREAPRSKLG